MSTQNLNLLIFSTFPIRKPIHGGQRRAAALKEAYRQVFGRVLFVGIVNADVFSRRDCDSHDLRAPLETQTLIRHQPEFENVTLGLSPAADSKVGAHVRKQIRTFKPDVICFEQPYLYLGLREILETEYPEIDIVYSSYNIEEPMLREIYGQLPALPREAAEKTLTLVSRVERELTQVSRVVIAVSHEDAQLLRPNSQNDILVIPNATDSPTSSPTDVLRVRKKMADLGVSRFALFAGSAHLPNVVGLLDVIGTRPGFIPWGSSLFIAGSVGNILFDAVNARDFFYGIVFFARAHIWGTVSNSLLASLLRSATVIVLPMTMGGGSNLKTAEALASGKPILATSHAFRGFEEFAHLARVHIIDNPDEFRQELHRILSQENVDDTPAETLDSTFLWSGQIESLASRLRLIFSD